jgi:NAD(P)-dependent dehydrogenase (short-subunit alcohol dehydrogenase family)
MMIVMTGGTRGLGSVAARQIEVPGTKIMGARHPSSVPDGWLAQRLDLASFASVRAFAASLPQGEISHLILNAGGQNADADGRTVDGVETTFDTNHLAHYLLLRLLMPRLSAGARIVITSSGTHDPAEKTGVPAPRHASAELLGYPERSAKHERSKMIAGMRAYSSSKLCNLMTARFLASTIEARAAHWSVFAFDPGLTPGTGLIRHQPWIVRTILWPLLPLFVPFAKGMNSLADAGRGLAQLATAETAPPGRLCAALRKGKLTWPDPSEIARNDTAVQALWDDSAKLVGIS